MSRFFSFDARITRTRLVAGVLLALPLAWITILLLRPGEPRVLVVVGVLGGATVAKLLTEAVRRRHDEQASGAATAVLLAAGAAVLAVATVFALGTGAFLVPKVVLVLLAVAWAALLLRPGSPAANSYGPAPRRPLLPAFGARSGSQGLFVAAVLAVLGGGLGYAGSRWLAAMRDQYARIERWVEAGQPGDAAPDALESAYREQHGR